MDEELYQSVGGQLVTYGSGEPFWMFGWVPPQLRDDTQHAIHEAAERSMSPSSVFDSMRSNEDVEFANLTRTWSNERVVRELGFAYTGAHQLTGSCVGGGAENVVATLNFFEVLVNGDPEKIFLPFYGYHYGRGRLHSGIRGRGEGSTGSGQAKAIQIDGVLDNAIEGLPKPIRTDDGIIWGKDVEMVWSAGDRIDQKWIDVGKKHPCTDVAKVNNSDEVRKSIVNGKPCTCASMYAFKASVVGEGKDACLLGQKQGSWSHQMSLLAYWKHPRHGPLFWLMNQWGLNAHGTCPSGMPRGGAWITAADVDWICKSEVYSFAGHTGWFSSVIDWDKI